METYQELVQQAPGLKREGSRGRIGNSEKVKSDICIVRNSQQDRFRTRATC